jgi:hypothetical protein
MSSVFADEIFITISNEMEDIVFDGKWTSEQEWKRSSDDKIIGDAGSIQLRSAHQNENLYFMIDVLTDTSFDRGFDKAIICIDSKNNDSMNPDKDDFCFVSSLGHNNGVILQGGTDFKASKYFSSFVSNSFVTSSGFSDKNDRYSSIPHIGYEFKIPIELLGRNNDYGFFVAVYDFKEDRYYIWPKNNQMTNIFDIPSPSSWGSLISPDKSLPEFNVPILLSIIALTSTVIISKFSRFLSY